MISASHQLGRTFAESLRDPAAQEAPINKQRIEDALPRRLQAEHGRDSLKRCEY